MTTVKNRCDAFDIRFVKGKRDAYRLVYDTENNATLRLEKWNTEHRQWEFLVVKPMYIIDTIDKTLLVGFVETITGAKRKEA